MDASLRRQGPSWMLPASAGSLVWLVAVYMLLCCPHSALEQHKL